MVTIPFWGEVKYIRTGECNHCGKCCLSVKLGGLMMENPCIDLDEDRCKFYVDEINTRKYGHCLILGRGNKPLELVKDRCWKKITADQIKWFNDNCPDYPAIEDVEAGHKLLSVCSFKFEVVSG